MGKDKKTILITNELKQVAAIITSLAVLVTAITPIVMHFSSPTSKAYKAAQRVERAMSRATNFTTAFTNSTEMTLQTNGTISFMDKNSNEVVVMTNNSVGYVVDKAQRVFVIKENMAKQVSNIKEAMNQMKNIQE